MKLIFINNLSKTLKHDLDTQFNSLRGYSLRLVFLDNTAEDAVIEGCKDGIASFRRFNEECFGPEGDVFTVNLVEELQSVTLSLGE